MTLISAVKGETSSVQIDHIPLLFKVVTIQEIKKMSVYRHNFLVWQLHK